MLQCLLRSTSLLALVAGVLIYYYPRLSTPANMVVLYPQWIMFGDSITQQAWMAGGLGQRLSEAYQRRLDIINRGYGGYNTKWALKVAPHVFPKTKSPQVARVVSLWWGANDSTLPMRAQSITLEEFKANLNSMIDMLRDPNSINYSPDTKIIIFSCPPMCEGQRREDVHRRWGPDIELDRKVERTEEFARAAGLVASQRGVGFVNVFDKMMAAAGDNPDQGLRRLLSDGLHLTAAGYDIVGDALLELLKAEYSELLPESIPRLFPDWATIDPNDPEKAFPKP